MGIAKEAGRLFCPLVVFAPVARVVCFCTRLMKLMMGIVSRSSETRTKTFFCLGEKIGRHSNRTSCDVSIRNDEVDGAEAAYEASISAQ